MPAVLAVTLGVALTSAAADVPPTLRSDSRAPYVHRLTLYDHDGTAISPADVPAAPYSPRATCSKCHDYAAIRCGWHFNADQPGIEAGRPGEPWILTDARSGTQLPISARGWPGTFKPEQIDLSRRQFVLAFGRHMPGGGLGDPDDDVVKASKEAPRWAISGRLEIDCMFCHSADNAHDPAEAARQIERENFRWSPTAALGLAVIRGEARSVPDDWDPLAPPNPDFPERQAPTVIYDRARFDADDRVFFNITRLPPVGRCYFCHSVREVGQDGSPTWQTAPDVHIAAGMVCTDCHRNDIGHMITRGYDDEMLHRTDRPGAPIAALSCAGCHLGVAGAVAPAAALGGRLGAPHPLHRGIPTLHFEKLTCTACHSGPWPNSRPHEVQTSLAHGLGLPSRERRDDQPPHILEPIFARQPDGRIAPHRLLWPSFWARMKGDSLEPLPPAIVQPLVAKVPPKAPSATEPLSDSQIGAILEQLAAKPDTGGEVVYLRAGWIYRRDRSGRVMADAASGARPCLWPLAHDVRPAVQSLGIRGCGDCHAANAPLYFGHAWLASAGGRAPPIRRMYELARLDPQLGRAWAAAFTLRPVCAWIGLLSAGALGLLLLRGAWAAMDSIALGFAASRKPIQ